MEMTRIQEGNTYICVFLFHHPNPLSPNPPSMQILTSLLDVTISDLQVWSATQPVPSSHGHEGPRLPLRVGNEEPRYNPIAKVADDMVISTACTTSCSELERTRTMGLVAHSGSHWINIDLASCLSSSKDV